LNELILARLQFGITSTYHFFFVPLTLGLSIFVAILETRYARSGDPALKRMTKFWGKLFLINFAMGVVTGIVMEFQFGMNWSEYARFMGDIFGAPLAIEALTAFFLESTFLGIWIFGWDKLSKSLHAAVMWLVAIGSNLSAFWILAANSFMHQPVGYVLRNGRAEMTDFFAVISNPHLVFQFPHVIASGVTTAAFFVLGISAYHLLKNGQQVNLFRRSFRMGVVYALIGVVLVILVGHAQTQHMVETQPMKMAAAEALWQTEDPASFSVISIPNEREQRDIFSIRIPGLLSFLSYNSFQGEVKGIKNLQSEYEQTYGPGNYVPPVAVNYFSFRIMVGAGFVMAAIALIGIYLARTKKFEQTPIYLKILLPAVALPYIANTTGWLLTELGRQPWIVFGLQRTEDAVSPSVSVGELAFSLIAFSLIYGILMIVDVYLLVRFARQEPSDDETEKASEASPALNLL
jgi:cytochrome bd ubiquinol oxidase subunit I